MKRSEEKRALLEEFLKADYAFIHVCPRVQGVVLPLDVMQSPMVTLKVSYNFAGQMTLDDELVNAELRFGERVFTCKIPWEAIWGISSLEDKRLIWPEDVPPELQEGLKTLGGVKSQAGGSSATKISSPATKSSSDASTDDAETTEDRPQQKPRPTLRRVK